MKLVVGSNGKLECTSQILSSSDGSVNEIYLSLKDSEYSSGRPSVVDLDFPDLEKHIKLARQGQVNLSVAFNSTCYSGQETTLQFQRRFYEFLDSLFNAGTNRIILAHPLLISLAKREHSDLHVSVSSFDMIDNETKLKYFMDMGADRVILAAELNRHPKKLRSIIEGYPQTEFEIILNNGCNYYCPFEYFHGSSQSHMHKFQGDNSKHYPAECSRQLLAEPWRVLVTPFIRPEDVGFYEEIGIQFFKLAGRNTKTDWILNALNAYQARSYDGNIIDILNRCYKLSKFRSEKAKIDIPNKRLDALLKEVAESEDYFEICKRCERLYEASKNG